MRCVSQHGTAGSAPLPPAAMHRRRLTSTWIRYGGRSKPTAPGMSSPGITTTIMSTFTLMVWYTCSTVGERDQNWCQSMQHKRGDCRSADKPATAPSCRKGSSGPWRRTALQGRRQIAAQLLFGCLLACCLHSKVHGHTQRHTANIRWLIPNCCLGRQGKPLPCLLAGEVRDHGQRVEHDGRGVRPHHKPAASTAGTAGAASAQRSRRARIDRCCWAALL